jgi:hypothetical protein
MARTNAKKNGNRVQIPSYITGSEGREAGKVLLFIRELDGELFVLRPDSRRFVDSLTKSVHFCTVHGLRLSHPIRHLFC